MADPITFAALVGALAAFLARRGQGDADGDGSDGNATGGNVTTQTTIADGVFPLPNIGARKAVITDHFQAVATTGEKGHRQHLGVDVAYVRLASEPQTLPRGTKLFYSPADTPVLAALPGKIWSATFSDLGHSVVIDHGNVGGVGPCCTFYQHLSSWSRAWKKGDPIIAGEQLGIVGGSLSGYPWHHLHFELWLPTRNKAVDPTPHMMKWARKAK